MSPRTGRPLAGVPLVDVVLGLTLTAIGLADALTQQEYDGGRARLVTAVLLQTLPIAWRRRHPLLAVALSALGVLVEVAGVEPYGGVYGLVGFLLLVHATARWADGVQQRYAVGGLAAGVVALTLSEGGDGPLGGLARIVMPLVLAAVAWAIGTLGRSAEEREQRLRLRAVAADRDRAASQAAAVEQERARISRDLHDVVGHALSGIALTAGAAQRTTRPAELTDALELIRTLSRDAATDVRRLVGLLREPTDETDTRPQPTLDEVPALVERARVAGLAVELRREGVPVAVSGGLHLAGYRVVQEGLTNVARHARGATATVTVDWEPGTLCVSVRNGPGERDGQAGGYGLVGLRERVALYEGTLSWEPTGDGGFVLEARFPL